MQPHQVRAQTFFIFAASFSHNFHVISIHVRGRVTVLLIKHYLPMWLLIIKKEREERPTQLWDFNLQPRPLPGPQRAAFFCFPSVSDGTSSRRLRAARGVYLWPAGSASLSQLPKQSHSTLCWVHQCSADTVTHTHAHTQICGHARTDAHCKKCPLQIVRLWASLALGSQRRWDRLWHFLYLLSYIWAFDIFINYSVTYYQLNYYLWYL